MTAIDAGDAVKTAKSRLPAWLRAITLAITVLLIAALGWVAYSSELIVGDSNHRNFHELEVAANGLETWPNSLRGLAKANFISSNIEKASAKDRADEWAGVAHIYHPSIGPYDLLYAVEPFSAKGNAKPCGELRARIQKHEQMRLPFIEGNRAGEGPQLKVVGAISIKELWIANHVETQELPKSQDSIDIDNVFATKLGERPTFGSFLCYAAVVPIAKLLAFDRTGQQFTDLLIVDGDRRVVRQLGSRPIAVDTLDKLAPSGSILDAAFSMSTADKTAKPTDPAPRLADALKPVTLEIAGESYLAYVRPFHLPPGVPGCETAAEGKNGLSLAVAVDDATLDSKQTVKTVGDAAPDTDAIVAPPPACFLVGLMPNKLLIRSALTLPPLPMVAFGFITAIALVLLPTARLLLIGTGDGLPGYAAAGVVLGIPMAAGFAALAILFAVDAVRERAGAHQQAVAIAQAMSTTIGHELKSTVGEAITDAEQYTDILEPVNGPLDRINPEPNRISTHVTPLPVVEAIAAIDKRGAILACDAKTIQFRDGSAAWPNIGGRDYFVRVRDGDSDGRQGSIKYVVAQVRSQTDGINKTILAFDPHDLGIRAANASMEQPEECAAAVIVASTVLPGLIAPVLPQPLGFMVVDSRNADRSPFPVIFHDQPEHAGVEYLGSELDAPGLRHLRGWLSSAAISTAPATMTFSGRYAGATRRFVAARIAGSSWVLLVNYALDDVDRVAAATAARATEAWLAVSIFLVLAWAVIIWIGGRQGSGWRSLWPHEPTGSMTRGYRGLIVTFAIGFFLAEVVIWTCDYGAWTLLSSVALMIGVGLYLLYRMRLGGQRPVTALTPSTERLYRWTIIAFICCAIIAPVHGFWRDARRLAVAQAEENAYTELTAPGGSIDRRNGAMVGVQRAFQLDCTKQRSNGCEKLDDSVDRFLPLKASAIQDRDPIDGLSATLWNWGGGIPIVETPGCIGIIDPRVDTQCKPADETVGGLVRHLVEPVPLASGNILSMTFVVVFVIGVGLLFWQLIGAVLRALCGFGIPLEGVTLPSLFIGADDLPPFGSVKLPARALIVGPPDELRARFVGADGKGVKTEIGGKMVEWTAIDLAAGAAPRLITGVLGNETAIVVYGLELIIRDTERRRRALEQLEQLDKRVGKDSHFVVLSVLSPIERILDAYEQDRGEPEADFALAKYREQLRWGRILERFTTFSFAPVEHVDRAYLDGPEARQSLAGLSTDQRRAVSCLFDETRWLPVPVIESVVGESASVVRKNYNEYPIEPHVYQRVLNPLVLDWARRLKAASPQAAIDYLRGAVIEHYQKCWSASTYAERVVLDRLAHGAFVNVERAVIPLSSLVRRGLVVFDPAPELMNQSFAMFVRQAERPERIELWRSKQPVGAWSAARLPILIAVPSMVIVLLASVLWTGQDVTTLLPLLATGAPALLATLSRGVRRTTD